MKESFPESIIIAGKTVKIQIMDNATDEDEWGSCDADLAVISIHPRCFSENKVRSTILHEALHYLLRTSGVFYGPLHGDEDSEECLVRLIENYFIPFVEGYVEN